MTSSSGGLKMSKKHYVLEFTVHDFDLQGYYTTMGEVYAYSEEEAIDIIKSYYGPFSYVDEIISVREVKE